MQGDPMPDLSSQLLPKLNNHRLGELPVDDDMILPYYDGLSLVNIPGTVCQLLLSLIHILFRRLHLC